MLVRRLMAGLGVGLLPSACGGGSLTLTEYVDRLNAVNDLVVPQAAALISDLEQATTPGEAGAVMEQMAALRVESLEATEALEPPQSIADLHQLFMGWEKRLVPIELSFASRAEVVSGWEEFFESPEVEAYRSALVDGKQVCTEYQETLDATADRGAFAETPWIPGALREVVDARLGCDLFPDDPDNVFRPPPTTVPEVSG